MKKYTSFIMVGWIFIMPALCTFNTASAAWDDLPTDHVFSATSFWYTPIAADAPLHANSTNFVTEFIRQKNKFYGHVAINTDQYGSPVYVSKPDYPIANVKYKDCGRSPGATNIASLEKQWQGVAMPQAAKPSPGTDAEMTIYDPVSDRMFEFWKTEKDASGNWFACWGGGFVNVSTSSGIFGKWGTTATGLPFLGGQITAEELIRGEIRHVIGISLVEVEHFTIRSWPALRSDGWNPNAIANRIPEGLRFRLDPAFNVDASSLHPVAKTIAKAAQKYGFVVWDKAGAVSIRAQNSSTQTQVGLVNLYPLLFKGTPNSRIFDGFPWDKLQFLSVDYGKP